MLSTNDVLLDGELAGVRHTGTCDKKGLIEWARSSTTSRCLSGRQVCEAVSCLLECAGSTVAGLMVSDVSKQSSPSSSRAKDTFTIAAQYKLNSIHLGA